MNLFGIQLMNVLNITVNNLDLVIKTNHCQHYLGNIITFHVCHQIDTLWALFLSEFNYE